MNELTNNYKDDQTGISYKLVGDYYLPDLIASVASIGAIGRFGRERLEYLKHYRRLEYINLLTSGKLNEHLIETDETANDQIEYISRQIAESEGVTERLKANDMMLWVSKKNNIQNRVIDIIRNELIYA